MYARIANANFPDKQGFKPVNYDIKKAILYNLNKNMNAEQYLREFKVAAENLGIAGNKNDEVML